MGTIILLNGASSAGKTSLARALQDRWETPLLYFGLDDVISMMPFRYTGDGEHADEGFRVQISSGNSTFTAGESGAAVANHAGQFVAGLAGAGFDLVLDYVLNQSLLDTMRRSLANCDVVFVGIHCDARVLSARESARGDRLKGLANRQAQTVHFCQSLYDLELESAGHSSTDLANQVLVHIRQQATTRGIGPNDG